MRYTYPGLIDVELTVSTEDDKTLTAYIHDQDPSITSKLGEREFRFVASNKFTITSVDHPEIWNDTFYLKGRSVNYKAFHSRTFSTIDRLEKVRQNIILALAELAASRGISLAGTKPEPEQLQLWD